MAPDAFPESPPAAALLAAPDKFPVGFDGRFFRISPLGDGRDPAPGLADGEGRLGAGLAEGEGRLGAGRAEGDGLLGALGRAPPEGLAPPEGRPPPGRASRSTG